ncbi:MAG: DUF1080 domain-containing protein [Planctomycetales bacterium]|nr:DUF1080 domain-containing protein [Planctomycetales bacterium]NIM08861.1 DUF1080 domain-containing protein [Planctomycetales bacterium]NIN08321.1 DUF1080 domain-containing protein [Planctomycetales bacterium]NIN77450.1 DUF1080 domain-containing protein [Planctomycetales bacterium]NIO34622.1 DUF1080 domain-containing protein [Planctomycetales bacterium]
MPGRRITLRQGLLWIFAVALAARVGAAEDMAVDLFASGTLDGWVVDAAPPARAKQTAAWSINDGLVHCAGGGYGFLRYDKLLADFVLSLEYRMSRGCNSGIGIRGVVFTGSLKTRPSFAGYELQILDDAGRKPDDHSSMALYRYLAAKENPTRPAGEWNQLEVTCRGPHMRITLNGKVVQDVDQSTDPQIKDKPTQGYISLQNHGKPIDFRNVTLRQLDP